jgi:hypothetical protein
VKTNLKRLLLTAAMLASNVAHAQPVDKCNVDFAFCAGRLYEEQAAHNAAAVLDSRCGGRIGYLGLINLKKLRTFADLAECQAHLAACGYGVMQQWVETSAAQERARKDCKGKM